MRSLKTYFLSTRPQFLPAVLIPVGLGASTAWLNTGMFSFAKLALSLVAAACYHSGMNVLNDYFDYRNGTDNINRNALTPFTGGSRFIQNGGMTPNETLALGALLIAAGSAIGIYLALETGWGLALIGLAGLLSGVFYSAPPIFLVGRGLGEITVGLNFGLLTVMGSYMVQSGRVDAAAVIVSLPVAFLIAALLYINEFPDFEADRDSGKRTLVVRLGPGRARYFFIVFLAGAYLSVIIGAASGYLPPMSLLSLVSAAFAARAWAGLIRNYGKGAALLPSIKSVIAAHMSCGVLLMAAQLLSARLLKSLL